MRRNSINHIDSFEEEDNLVPGVETQVTPVPEVQPVEQPEEQQQPKSQNRTPKEAGQNTERAELDSGFWTEAGNWLSENFDPLNRIDKGADDLAELTEGTFVEGATQGLADAVPNRKELRERAAPVPVLGQLLAAGAGVDAFAMTPISLGARLSNQQLPEAALPPAEMEEVLGGELAFELGRLLAPTLIGGPATGFKALAAESALETINQRSADDVVFGRQTAVLLGEVADKLGQDGTALTEELIRGETPRAQTVNAIIGYLTNFGVNISVDAATSKILRALGKNAPTQVAEEVAEVTGKEPKVVQMSLDDIELPKKGDPDLDINEASTIDTGVAKAPKGKVVNEEAIVAHTLKRQAPTVTNVETRGFTNYSVFSNKDSIQKALKEAIQYMEKIEGNQAARQKMYVDADNWIRQFVDESNASIDLDRALEDFPLSAMVKPLAEGGTRKGANFLTEEAITTKPGAAAVTLLGEELGERLSASARNAINLDNGGKDFSNAVEQFLELQDKSEMFLLPLRRFKQEWNLGGIAQQRDFKAGLQNDLGLKKSKRKLSESAPSEEFRRIYKDAEDVGKTPRQLWQAFQAGDATAGQTLKDFLSLVAYAPPNTALAHVDNLERVLYNELRKGNRAASTRLLYASYLTRLAPQVASLGSNILNLVKEPVGNFLGKEERYAYGQVLGALGAFSDALAVGKRTFQRGYSVNAGTKLDASVYNSKVRDEQLDRLWEGVQKELHKTKAGKREWVVAWSSYMRQKLSNSPLNTWAGRALTAGDDTSKVIYGSMTANGQAYREATELGIKPGSFAFKRLVNQKYKEAFVNGIKNGELTPSVNDAASALTFSQPIPKDGNVIDGAFRTLYDAANENQFWQFVSPFTRVSYWTLEKGGVLLAGSIPGVGGKILGAVVPKYKKIMAGEMGELARMQLKSNLNFAGYTSFMVAGLSANGLMTGNNPPEGMPRTSFIIPTNNKDGYIAIPYGRLEPIATPFALLTDMVQNFRDNIWTEQQYSKAVEEFVVALGLATFDKSFMTGMSNSASLFDVNNFGEGTVISGVGQVSPVVTSRGIPIGGGAALTRMISDWINPYDTISKGDPNIFRNIWAALAERNFGGWTNPVKFDPLTGQAIQTTNQMGKDNYWKGVVSSLTNEFYPGRVKGGDRISVTLHGGEKSSIYAELDKLDYDVKRLHNFRTFEGVGLSLEEQSILSKDTHDIGELPKGLKAYFSSKQYKRSWSVIQKKRSEGTEESLDIAEKELKSIQSEITSIFNRAKDKAGRLGRLKDKPGYAQKHDELVFGPKNSQASRNSSPNESVQEILDMPIK